MAAGSRVGARLNVDLRIFEQSASTGKPSLDGWKVALAGGRQFARLEPQAVAEIITVRIAP
jgi:hypothetical protein